MLLAIMTAYVVFYYEVGLEEFLEVRGENTMPVVRKLAQEEVRTIERKALGTRRATELEYNRYLADFMSGDYGEVKLLEGEKRLTVRNRIKAAADRHEPPLALTFLRTRGDTLR